MSSNLEKYKKELKDLIMEGGSLFKNLEKKKEKETIFRAGYQKWYTIAQATVKQILPNRLEEFNHLYYDPKRKSIDSSTFEIKDWFLGSDLICDYGEEGSLYEAVKMRFQNQILVLEAAESRFESSLFDIKQIVQADLFDSELDAAKELNKNGFARGAGAVAGVVLEKHLSQVCENHGISITKKEPTINDYNQTLKDNNVIEVKDWRFIQHLADLRNLCDHNKKKEPEKIDIGDMISGVEKISKIIF